MNDSSLQSTNAAFFFTLQRCTICFTPLHHPLISITISYSIGTSTDERRQRRVVVHWYTMWNENILIFTLRALRSADFSTFFSSPVGAYTHTLHGTVCDALSAADRPTSEYHLFGIRFSGGLLFEHASSPQQSNDTLCLLFLFLFTSHSSFDENERSAHNVEALARECKMWKWIFTIFPVENEKIKNLCIHYECLCCFCSTILTLYALLTHKLDCAFLFQHLMHNTLSESRLHFTRSCWMLKLKAGLNRTREFML